jgi:hypothetical protein
MKLIDNPAGNYRFLTGIAPYSSGAVAMPGYEIVHVTLHKPQPYRPGFELIDQYLTKRNRSRQALCAIELRSPKPFTFEGFAEFNQGYQEILATWNLLIDGRNPVARTNIAPELFPPDAPMLHAFSYTIPTEQISDTPLTFVVAGAGDLINQDLSPEAIVRAGDTSPEAMREKAAHVMNTMQARLVGLNAEWSQVTTVDIYTVHPLQPYLTSTILEIIGQPTSMQGVNWLYGRPPIAGVEFEMDVRGIRHEIRIRK